MHLFAFDFRLFILSKVAWVKGLLVASAKPLFLTGLFVTCLNNKPTAGYLWFWYAVPFKRKLSLRSRGRIIGLFCRQEKLIARSVDSVNASIDSTEENLSWNRKIFISRRRKRWSTWSSLKEIVNLVFNKSTGETRRTRLSKLILHKKMPRKEQTVKIGFKKNFDIKYQRMVLNH